VVDNWPGRVSREVKMGEEKLEKAKRSQARGVAFRKKIREAQEEMNKKRSKKRSARGRMTVHVR